jgi:hypothetical protein
MSAQRRITARGVRLNASVGCSPSRSGVLAPGRPKDALLARTAGQDARRTLSTYLSYHLAALADAGMVRVQRRGSTPGVPAGEAQVVGRHGRAEPLDRSGGGWL